MQEQFKRLGDVVTVNPESMGRDYPYSEIAYVDISSVGSEIFEGAKKIDVEDAPSRAKRIVVDGDTILSTVRPNRRSFLYIKNPPANMIVSTGFAVLRPSNYIDKRYLYCAIRNQEFTDYLTNNAKGAAYPAVDTETIERAEIYLPSLLTQRKIAAILSAYDDLIENNARRLQILEDMAQTLYREWFVHFRFPGHDNVRMVDSDTELGEVPHGWEVKELQDADVLIIDGDRGKNYPSKNEFSEEGYCLFLNAGNIQNDKFEFLKKNFITEEKDSLLRKGRLLPNDIVLTTRGTVGRLAFHSENALYKNVRINSGMVIIRSLSLNQNSLYWFHFLKSPWMKGQYQLFSSGAAQPQLPIKDMKRINVLVPAEKMSIYFCEIIMPFINQMDILQLTNWKLRYTRDLLLPKLVSGEVDVSELEIDVVVN